MDSLLKRFLWLSRDFWQRNQSVCCRIHHIHRTWLRLIILCFWRRWPWKKLVTAVLKTIPKEEFLASFQQLYERSKACIYRDRRNVCWEIINQLFLIYKTRILVARVLELFEYTVYNVLLHRWSFVKDVEFKFFTSLNMEIRIFINFIVSIDDYHSLNVDTN